MRYLLLICGDEESAEQWEASGIVGCDGWSEEMLRRGVLLGGVALRPPADATTVRLRGEELLLTDGPFAETKDQVGGYNLIQCADLDEAIEIASKHPAARFGSVEIRPVLEL